ncbi:hypothetical protein CRUP_029412 [Coryphaenoides rupestris]|nr:hypothetical protein CRUP_029412 [Coryphaenoides rupestris]
MSDSDVESVDSVTLVTPVCPPAKRRRVVDPSTISSVPIYSNKVDNCLRLKPNTVAITHNSSECDDAEAVLSLESAGPELQDDFFSFTDSEEDVEEFKPRGKTREAVALRSPSPPTTPSTPQLQLSPQAWRAMCEVNSRLGSVVSLLSSSPERVTTRRRGPTRAAAAAATRLSLTDDDDIILVTPVEPPPEEPVVGREFKLKFRCQTGNSTGSPVVSSRPLSEAVEALSVKLKVPPSRILLLRNEVELPADFLGQSARPDHR